MFELHIFSLESHSIAYHSLFLVVNILLILFSKPLVEFFNHGNKDTFQLSVLRSVNVLFILLQIVDYLISRTTLAYSNYFSNFASTMFILYISAILYTVISYLARKRFGKEKSLDGKLTHTDTYNSRLIDIFLLVGITLTVIYVIINIWSLDSLVETTGFLGLMVAFLALTNQIWAPDPYYCMVILNSEMIEDGDVICMDDDSHEYIVSRVTFIYTILYDIKNNHRSMIRNSKLIDKKIENLSKKVAIEGLRCRLKYKIGYPQMDGTYDIKTHLPYQYKEFINSIEMMFKQANESALKDEHAKINTQTPFEWFLTSTGDYALEFTLVYYLDTIPNTKLTKTVRNHLYKTEAKVNRYVYEASLCLGISLATPDLVLYEKGQV